MYRAEDGSGTEIGSYTSRLGLAVSEDGLHFAARPEPVFYPAHDAQEANEWPGGCEDPRLVEGPDGLYVLTYTQWNRQTTHLAVATSRDLEHWEKQGPAFAKERWTGSTRTSAQSREPSSVRCKTGGCRR